MNFNTIKSITRFLKPFMRITNRLQHRKRGQRLILMYHGISKLPKFNCVTLSLFKEQISWLKGKYTVIPLSDLVENLKTPVYPRQSNLASITFDDAYVNFAELALPVLQDYKCHATVFVPAGKVGLYNDWDKSIGGFHKMEIMSYKILRQLPQELVEIGSHGISHIPLNRLSYSEIKREIVESRLEIEQNIGRYVRFFAFPYGAYPFVHRLMLDDYEKPFWGSYRAMCTSWWGRDNSKRDVYMLRRIGIWDSDSMSDFINKLNGYYDWLEKKEVVGRHFKMARAFLVHYFKDG